MYFSGYQWLAVLVLDLVVRTLYLAIAAGSPFFVIIAVPLSIIHWILLLVISSFLTVHHVRTRYSVPIVLFVANALFCSGFAAFLAGSVKNGRMTSCAVGSDRCDWINGTITDLGIQTIALYTGTQIVVNLIPVLVAWLFSARRAVQSRQGTL